MSHEIIYANTTGVRVSGGTVSLDHDTFSLASYYNTTDLEIDSGAGAVTIGADNAFHATGDYIDNLSSQNFDLSSNGTTFDQSNNFRIEDRMFDRVNNSSSGLITWVPNNVFVSAVGTGPSGMTDSNIDRAIDAIGSGGVVNIEAGTFAQSVTIDRAVTLIGSGDGSSPAPATVIAHRPGPPWQSPRRAVRSPSKTFRLPVPAARRAFCLVRPALP